MTRLPQLLRVLPNEADAAIADLLRYLEPVPLLAEDYQRAIARITTLSDEIAALVQVRE
jgi:hypothetical protein